MVSAATPIPGAKACEAQVREGRDLAEKGDGTDRGRAGVVSRACAPLFLEPACRTAHERFDVPPPGARAVVLATACRQAYCASLEAPRPALCDSDPSTLLPAELANAWSEFVPAALRHDHGRKAEHVIKTMRAPAPAR